MSSSRLSARAVALRAAVVAAGLTTSVATSGCDRVMARVLDGTSMDGESCAGWSIRHGSPESCCRDIGAAYDPASHGCIWAAVPGPFVPPAMSEPA
jgi:hypothetical protein